MDNSPQVLERDTSSPKSYNPKTKSKNVPFQYTPKHSICILVICLLVFILFQSSTIIQRLQLSLCASSESMIEKLRISSESMTEKLRSSESMMENLRNSSESMTEKLRSSESMMEKLRNYSESMTEKLRSSESMMEKLRSSSESMKEKLRHAVTFVPLKDLRYANSALVGHTWFMSSMYDTHEENEVQYQHFPSTASKGRVLCIKGHDNHDGSWNYYALAWPDALPHNATLMKGLTFVSYNHYDYGNIWHGLSAVFPFVGWHIKNGCKLPSRWILYHWGELRVRMGHWLTLVLESTFDGPINIERFEGIEEDRPVCFEEAVVMRHNEGGMSRVRRMETYDYMRCKARAACNVSTRGHVVSNTSNEQLIGLTLFLRDGARSFRNQSSVIDIFKSECAKFEGCRLLVAHSNNLTFCEQVQVMSSTDILVSPHGAQLTNMFLMDRDSSVMEFFPKGWLKLAGVGQYVYHWIASWSGMRHQGAYRDLNGDPCPFPEDDRRCMSIFKNAQIGHNESYFREWTRHVLTEVKVRKIEEAKDGKLVSTDCSCKS